MTSLLRTHAVALRALLLLTLVLGLAYPLAVTGIASLLLPGQAAGSLLTDSGGEVVGSTLIGQSFTDADGVALPGYVQPRPSAAGDGYDAAASSGSNLGPENPDLAATVAQRIAVVAEREGVAESAVPADAVTASASGLDPHISPAYAELQVPRIARERGLQVAVVEELVRDSIAPAVAGFVGDPVVNVLELNLALDQLS